MKMKKIVFITVALITMIAFMGTAFAVELTPPKSWTSSVCYRSFPTKNTFSKPASNSWNYLSVIVENLSFSRSVDNGIYLDACAESSSGVTMGLPGQLFPGESYDAGSVDVYETEADHNPIRLRIMNPYSQEEVVPNMESHGHFKATYY